MKPLFPTAVILVCDLIHISHLNSILMLCDCAGERMALEVALRYWSCRYFKISIFGSKVSLCFVYTEKWQIRWIGTSMIFSLFGSRLGLLHLRVCKGACLWRRLCAWTLLVNVLRSVIVKTESGGGVKSNIYRLHLDLIVKQPCCNATFRNHKLCCVNVFLHKNDETKNSSGL